MLDVTLYKLPNGEKETITMTNIHKGDALFFEHHPVSMEQLTTGQIVLYAEAKEDEDGEMEESIFLVPESMSCELAMSHLRKLTEEML